MLVIIPVELQLDTEEEFTCETYVALSLSTQSIQFEWSEGCRGLQNLK